MTGAENSTYGPEKYVVEYEYDNAGRLTRKVIRDNPVDDDTVRFDARYGYDGRGNLIHEKVLQYSPSNDRMIVTHERETEYDLGRNPTTVKYFDSYGLAFTETRSYARGYQLTDFSTQVASGRTSGVNRVGINTSGSYTYDTNNNLIGTKQLDAYLPAQSNRRIAYRENWTFTYDRKNRMKSQTHERAAGVRENLWWDGTGRVWQRWNDDSVSGDWEPELTRYVYDGSQLAQEHHWIVFNYEGTWVYSYGYITRDYLYEPGGLRQRESSDGQNFTDRYLFTDSGSISARADRSSSTTITRTMRLASGDRLPDTLLGPGATAENWSNLSHLASRSSIIRDFGGGTSDEMKGFDALQQVGDRHYLTGLGRWVNRMGNNSYLGPTGSGTRFGQAGPSGGSITNGNIRTTKVPTMKSIFSPYDEAANAPVKVDDPDLACDCYDRDTDEYRECCCLLMYCCKSINPTSMGSIPCVEPGIPYCQCGDAAHHLPDYGFIDFVGALAQYECFIRPPLAVWCDKCNCPDAFNNASDSVTDYLNNNPDLFTYNDGESDFTCYYFDCVEAGCCYYQHWWGWYDPDLDIPPYATDSQIGCHNIHIFDFPEHTGDLWIFDNFRPPCNPPSADTVGFVYECP
jgi:hypothetical protein